MKSQYSFKHWFIAWSFWLNLCVGLITLILWFPINCRVASSLSGDWLDLRPNFLKWFYAYGLWYGLIPLATLALYFIRRRKFFYTALFIAYAIPIFWLVICVAVYVFGGMTMSGTWDW